ncbi:shadow of prion protein 2 [Synchiropus splendidus]|uniref:shadow of prion protein 2 n=1 Tax=Synchiropus splendidus TaxID=270530 RepID=UPI00237E40CF|nr:shadow of prion protein 2 [Synchiropus splendidus]
MRKLLSVWICLLLVITLCPGAWFTEGKPSGGSKGGKKGDSKKNSSILGFSKPGLKVTGASAAGMLGGTGTGLSLGFFGRHRHGSRGHKNERQPPPYYDEHQGSNNRSRWRAIFSSAPPPVLSNIFTRVLPFLILVWMREI